jgi:hypothetical protein
MRFLDEKMRHSDSEEIHSFPYRLSEKKLHAFFISPMRATCPAHLSLVDSNNMIFDEEEIIALLIMQYSAVSCHFLLLNFRTFSAPSFRILPIDTSPLI